MSIRKIETKHVLKLEAYHSDLNGVHRDEVAFIGSEIKPVQLGTSEDKNNYYEYWLIVQRGKPIIVKHVEFRSSGSDYFHQEYFKLDKTLDIDLDFTEVVNID